MSRRLAGARSTQRAGRFGRRTARTFPLFPPPQKNRSPPSDSSPDTPTPGGISSRSRTSPVPGSTRLTSLSSPSQVPCQSSPSTQVTPVTKRLDSMCEESPPFRDRSDGSSGPDTGRPRASLRPTRAPSHRRRRAPGWWRAPRRSSDRSSGCDPRRSETGAGRRRPFPRARRRRSSAPSSPLAGSKAFSLSPAANQTC